jgi:hypothetical protein
VNVSSAPAKADAVLAEYRSKVQSLQGKITVLRMRKHWALVATLTFAVLWAALLIAALNGTTLHFAALVIPTFGVILGLQTFLRSRAKSIALAHKSSFYERGIDRLEDNWRGKGSTGMDFARDHHLYQYDLDILGEGSLFELISTTRSEVGAERLASFLLDPPALEEARARQEAVKALRDATSLREEVAVLGRYQFQNCRGEYFREWLNLPILKVHRIVPIFLLFSGTATLALGLLGYAGIFHWIQIAPLLIPLLAAQAGICLALVRRIRVHIKTLLAIGGDVVVLRQGVGLIERQCFQSAKLRNLVERLRLRKAAARLRKLERLLVAVKRREDITLYGFSLWLAAGTQLVLAVERWRAVHQKDLEDWLDTWAEFEALNALACYSWEHPDHTFPELLDGSARFEATNLCHPLLPRDCCVGNDVSLNSATAFYVISGSNMAGKSTLLRAIGLNAVLASAGAPVCAIGARMTVFHVCASISIKDSLSEGKSKFLAEVERLRESIGFAGTGRPVLFLVDEVLSGTNSRDRKIAAEALIRALVAGSAVGALSTHDLALTEIGENPELRGVNMHMQSENPEEPLAFDYRLKPGISQQTNALAIVRMMGISV